ncbi:hypothetical protein D5S17_10955 [Pseudonocardiaceae bacterium YIM PH 21723]|nr:hypothetical protein D5S17_10955 [Pseudonocardiaceae bacterium YIM PH 21723]
MTLTRRASVFLLLFALWSWLIWPNFLRNVWVDPRAWSESGAPTPFFTVHLVLTVVSLILGSVIGVIGFRGFRASTTTKKKE